MIRRYTQHREAPSKLLTKEKAALQATGSKPSWQADVYVDSMSNATCRAYHALPERLYILKGADPNTPGSLPTVLYQGGEGPFHYSLKEMVEVLKKETGIEFKSLDNFNMQ
jgi:hypothetical protein